MVYMVSHLPSIYPRYVSIYTIRLDPMGYDDFGLSRVSDPVQHDNMSHPCCRNQSPPGPWILLMMGTSGVSRNGHGMWSQHISKLAPRNDIVNVTNVATGHQAMWHFSSVATFIVFMPECNHHTSLLLSWWDLKR